MGVVQSGGQESFGEQGSIVPAPGSSEIASHTGPEWRLHFLANRTEWLWFDPAEGLAIWRGPDGPHGFPAPSLAEVLACVERRTVG
jgi:hypothetical protein